MTGFIVVLPHPFVQNHLAQVRVCVCGMWPDHHVHTGERMYCSCGECQELRTRERIDTNMHVVKYVAQIMVSDDMARDEGIIEDTRPVPPYSVPTRMSRVRLHVSRFVVRFRRRLRSRIAGIDLNDDDHDW